MPTLQQELERIGAERLAASRQADRAARLAMLRSAAECVGACLLGLSIMFLAFKVNDLEWGRILLYSGMIVGYSGMIWSLASAYTRGEKRGDW